VELDPNSFYWVVANYYLPAGMLTGVNQWYESPLTYEFYFGYDDDWGNGFEAPANGYWSLLGHSPNGSGLAVRLLGSAIPEPTAGGLAFAGMMALLLGSGRFRRRVPARGLVAFTS
jgi:hypothetical protein